MTHARRLLFLLSCALLSAAITLALPPYFPLLEADSASYLEFHSSRTAIYPVFLREMQQLGLSPEQIVYPQTLLFALAVTVLLAALLRAGVSRGLVLLVAIALGANGYYSSFERTIMSESIFFSVMMVTVAFWIDYLRTGRAAFLALTGLGVGFLIEIRPAGVFLAPMLPVSVWLKWHRRDVAWPLLLAALAVPIAIGPIVEQRLYHSQHGEQRESVAGPAALGKAAMLVRDDTEFSGPHREPLGILGRQLAATYRPVHEFLAGLPSRAAYPIMVAGYEGAAQFSIVNHDVVTISLQFGVLDEILIHELAKQSILANVSGYLRLSLLHYLGQWSIMPLKLPPTAAAVNNYVASYPGVPLDGLLADVFLRPTPSPRAYVVYPAFLAAGAVTLVLGLALIAFVLRPSLGDSGPGRYLMLAAFFAASCHVYTLLVSFINVSTPRFLMAVYPQLLMAALFLTLAFLCKRSRAAVSLPSATRERKAAAGGKT